MRFERRAIASCVLALVVTTTAFAEFPADGTAPTEGWPYGFRSVIDTATYPLASDKRRRLGHVAGGGVEGHRQLAAAGVERRDVLQSRPPGHRRRLHRGRRELLAERPHPADQEDLHQ